MQIFHVTSTVNSTCVLQQGQVHGCLQVKSLKINSIFGAGKKENSTCIIDWKLGTCSFPPPSGYIKDQCNYCIKENM